MSKKRLCLFVYSCYQSAVIMVTRKTHFEYLTELFQTGGNYYGDIEPNIWRFKIPIFDLICVGSQISISKFNFFDKKFEKEAVSEIYTERKIQLQSGKI